MINNKPVVIDLFAGAGGLSEGFRQAGYFIAGSVEIDEDAAKSHHVNFPESVLIQQDITTLSAQELLDKCGLRKGEVDVVIGGPPCQSFSMAGKRLIDDPRHVLFQEFVRIVEYIEPTSFVMENVVGLLSMSNGKFKEAILEAFSEIGYEVDVTILNSANYGVPQTRQRTIFIGNKIGKKVTFPLPTHSKNGVNNLLDWTTVGEAISDLPSLEESAGEEKIFYKNSPSQWYQLYIRGIISYKKYISHMLNGDTFNLSGIELEETVLYNHWTSKSGEKTKERFYCINQGENWEALPEHLKTNGKYSNLYRRLELNKPSVTLTNIRKSMFIHPTEHRLLTVREGARIQSFPDYIRFMGKKGSQQQQIGNAVPPLLGYALGTHIFNTYLKV